MELGCRDGKEVVVVGVTSGRASAGARVSRERGELSSWDGYGEEEPEGDEPREKSSVGMGKGSSVGTEKDPVWGQGMVW